MVMCEWFQINTENYMELISLNKNSHRDFFF